MSGGFEVRLAAREVILSPISLRFGNVHSLFRDPQSKL